MKLIPYWHDTAESSGDDRRTPVPEHVNVAVIGAGFTGLSAALTLAESGADVAVLERHTVGWGASGRNGGMATTGLAVGLGSAIKRYGRDRALAMFREYNKAIDTIEKLVSNHGIDCDFERTGKISLAVRDSHVDAFRATRDELHRVGNYPEITVLDRESIHTELGSDFYCGGMVDPLGAGLHSGKFAQGLARAARAAGATICENAEVTGLRRISGTAHEVQTTRGVIRADHVLVATSGYTGRITPWLQRRIVPVGSFVIVTEPLRKDTVDRILPHRRQASDSKMLTYYFRITPDDRLLFGGRARFALSNPTSDLKSARILQEAMTTVFPYLHGVGIDYTWGGLVDLSMDRMVHAGLHKGLFYSICYSGHGVQMATYMGQQMAKVITGDTTANPWASLAFPPVPGHFGPPWFLPFIGGAAKVIDRINW